MMEFKEISEKMGEHSQLITNDSEVKDFFKENVKDLDVIYVGKDSDSDYCMVYNKDSDTDYCIVCNPRYFIKKGLKTALVVGGSIFAFKKIKEIAGSIKEKLKKKKK